MKKENERFSSPNWEAVNHRQEVADILRQQIEESIETTCPPLKYCGEKSGREKRINRAWRKEMKKMAKEGHFSPIQLERKRN